MSFDKNGLLEIRGQKALLRLSRRGDVGDYVCEHCSGGGTPYLLTSYMKPDLAGTVNRLNIEHRTSNIERRIMMTLRFIYCKTSESR